MIHKKLLTAMLKKDFKLFLCLLLLDLLIMPFVYVNFPTMMDDASLLFNFYFIYLLLLIIILIRRQLGFTMKREEKIHDYQLPLTKRSLILTRLTVGILVFLIPYLIAWLIMGILMLDRHATVISIWNGTVQLMLAMVIYLCFCAWVFLRSRKSFQAMLTIAVWTLAPVFVVSASVDIMRETVTYRYQLREFFTLLHDFGCLPGLFTLAAKGLICDSTFPSLGSCLLVDGIYLAVALPAVYQVTKNSAGNEHKTLMQSAVFKLMPAASAAGVLIWGSLTAVRPQQCLLSVILAAVLYLLIRFLSYSKIQLNKMMLLVLTVEFLVVQGIFLSWRVSGGWGMTRQTTVEDVFFINHYDGLGKVGSYYKYFNVENTASLSKEDKEILIQAQVETDKRYRRQGLKDAAGVIQMIYRTHDDKYSYYLPYYADIMEPAIELLEEQDVPIFTYLHVDYPGWENAFYLQGLNIKLF